MESTRIDSTKGSGDGVDGRRDRLLEALGQRDVARLLEAGLTFVDCAGQEGLDGRRGVGLVALGADDLVGRQDQRVGARFVARVGGLQVEGQVLAAFVLNLALSIDLLALAVVSSTGPLPLSICADLILF